MRGKIVFLISLLLIVYVGYSLESTSNVGNIIGGEGATNNQVLPATNNGENTSIISNKVKSNDIVCDVNGDGKVNVQDIVLINKEIIGENPFLKYPSNADPNSDGKITKADYTFCINKILEENYSVRGNKICDVNLDGKINVQDLLLIKKEVKSQSRLLDYFPYDANSDGKITNLDYLICLNKIFEIPYSTRDKIPCDVNGDGVVNNYDLSLINEEVNGMSPLLKYPSNADPNRDGKITSEDYAICKNITFKEKYSSKVQTGEFKKKPFIKVYGSDVSITYEYEVNGKPVETEFDYSDGNRSYGFTTNGNVKLGPGNKYPVNFYKSYKFYIKYNGKGVYQGSFHISPEYNCNSVHTESQCKNIPYCTPIYGKKIFSFHKGRPQIVFRGCKYKGSNIQGTNHNISPKPNPEQGLPTYKKTGEFKKKPFIKVYGSDVSITYEYEVNGKPVETEFDYSDGNKSYGFTTNGNVKLGPGNKYPADFYKTYKFYIKYNGKGVYQGSFHISPRFDCNSIHTESQCKDLPYCTPIYSRKLFSFHKGRPQVVFRGCKDKGSNTGKFKKIPTVKISKKKVFINYEYDVNEKPVETYFSCFSKGKSIYSFNSYGNIELGLGTKYPLKDGINYGFSVVYDGLNVYQGSFHINPKLDCSSIHTESQCKNIPYCTPIYGRKLFSFHKGQPQVVFRGCKDKESNIQGTNHNISPNPNPEHNPNIGSVE